MNVHTDLHRLIDEVLDDDPRRALIAYRRLAKEHVPWLEQRVVALARREGWNWAKIGRLLDVSRAALHARFRTIAPRVAPQREEYGERWERDSTRVINLARAPVDDEPIAW